MGKITVDTTTNIEIEPGQIIRLTTMGGSGGVILEAFEASHGIGQAEVEGKKIVFSLDGDQAEALRDALTDWIGDGVDR